MPTGYMGKILWVDLTEGTFKEETLPEEIYRQYLGGYWFLLADYSNIVQT